MKLPTLKLFTKQKAVGIAYILLGVLIFFLFKPTAGNSVFSRFDFNLGESYWTIPILQLNTFMAVNVLAAICILCGVILILLNTRLIAVKFFTIGTIIFFIFV